MAKYIQGKFKPRNPHKYRGDLNNIIARSSWEMRFLHWCDMNSNVLEYASEEVVIPYICETDGRWHRYFVDMYVKVREADDKVSTYLVEIKPFKETQPPKFSGKQTPRYLTEANTFIKNQSKWKAARKYAEDRGAKFIIITEKELGIGSKRQK